MRRAHLFAGVLERHDKERFEVTVLNAEPRDDSPEQKRIVDAVDAFVDVLEVDDDRLVELIKKKEIDILVNLDFANERLRASRLSGAPRAGAGELSRLPGDRRRPQLRLFHRRLHRHSAGGGKWFVEKIVYLPDSYQPNDSKREIADAPISRREAGLPEAGVRLLLLQQQLQAQPRQFDALVAHPLACPGSVLWLLQDNDPRSAI